MLTVQVLDNGRVAFTGRLDASQAATAQAALDATSGVVVLDCVGLDYLASAGLGVLLKTHKRLAAHGGRLRLVGVRPALRDIFAYSGFDQVFEIESA
ncbi:MAG TPA: STAS domain-containing protein [Burkholderiaceae bacterium]|nr:STAS domain-containing protein [Burkholderiaceae bacterium]